MFELFRKHPQVLLFGILTAMFSGPGQTFLVSLFIPAMQREFGMSPAAIAAVYAAASLASAFLLPWIGRLMDRVRLVKLTLWACALLTAGCLVLSQSRGILTLLAGFLLVRNLGQGVLTMISSTTMTRVFGAMRGKALGIANLGYPLSEALFPLMISSWILAHGWRSGWILLAVLTAVFFTPAVFFLIRRDPHEEAHAEYNVIDENEFSGRHQHRGRDWTLREMLRDWRYYAVMTPLLLAPGIITALFFHQAGLFGAWKGWSLHLLSGGFIVFAVFRVLASLLTGIGVDRLSARRLYSFMLVPMAFGLLFLLLDSSPVWCYVYFAGLGITMGYAMTVTGALFAEFYGVTHLGSMKGINSMMTNTSAAVAPPIMGLLLDGGVNPELIVLGMAGLVVAAVFVTRAACRRPRRLA